MSLPLPHKNNGSGPSTAVEIDNIKYDILQLAQGLAALHQVAKAHETLITRLARVALDKTPKAGAGVVLLRGRQDEDELQAFLDAIESQKVREPS